MNKILILVFISFLFGGECVEQCTKEYPFFMVDQKCANFNNVCINTSHETCQSLLNKCAQCAPSNFTTSALINMLTFLKHKASKKDIERKVLELKNQLNSIRNFLHRNIYKFLIEEMTSNKQESENKFKILIFVVIILGLMNLVMVFEIKFRFFGEHNSEAKIANLIDPKIENLKTHIDTRINDIPQKLSIKESIKVKRLDEQTSVHISSLDNVVKIKHKIFANWVNAKYQDIKKMVLKLNEDILDNNEFLEKKIRSADDNIKCDIDDKIDPNQILILQLRGNLKLPELIQINKDQTIDQFKLILSKLINVGLENLCLFRDSNAVIELGVLKDYDWVDVIKKEIGNVTPCSIFSFTNQTDDIQYSNFDNVEKLKREIANSLGLPIDDVILFFKNNILENKDVIFQTGIKDGSKIRYCHMIQKATVNFEIKKIGDGDYSEIYEGKDPVSRMDAIFKKYNISEENYKNFLNEIKTYQILKSSERFVKLNAVFKDQNDFYLSMEKLKGSLDSCINRNDLPDDRTLVKWAKQILEALKELHDNHVIHRDVKPSNILVDKDRNLKLSSFGIAKYIQSTDKKYKFKGSPQLKSESFRYMAPEVCNAESFGIESDVWSFGATMIKIATGIQPFDGLDGEAVATKLCQTKCIRYKLKPSQNSLQKFIDNCLKSNPKDRLTVDNLLKHEFLTSA